MGNEVQYFLLQLKLWDIPEHRFSCQCIIQTVPLQRSRQEAKKLNYQFIYVYMYITRSLTNYNHSMHNILIHVT